MAVSLAQQFHSKEFIHSQKNIWTRMFIDTYLYNQKLETAQASSTGRIKCGIIIQWNTTWQ